MRPANILHIFTDQQRVDSIHALGGGVAQTPHIDRLVREGTVFSSAYTPCAECVPARAAMITGMYADKTGCGSNADSMPPCDQPTFMSRLAQAGYHTHGVGKCHFTPDPWAMRGFLTRDTSEEIAEHPEGDDYLKFLENQGIAHVLEPHGIRGELYYVPQPSQLPQSLHPTQWVGDRSLDFLRSRQGKSEPWYLYAGFIHPHPPFAPPNPWHKLYRAPEMPLPHIPEANEDLLCYVNHFQNRYKYRDRGLDLNLVRCMRAYYQACVTFIDYQVGRLLAALEEVGQLDQTLIVYTADHGELLGDFGCFGKRSFHDASQRVPLIVRQPGRFKAGRVCSTPASLVDLLPTFLSSAGLPIPEDSDGSDLMEISKGDRSRKNVFFHYHKGEDAILGAVTEDWKFAWSMPDQKAFLLDRKETPERHNYATAPIAADILADLDEQVRHRAQAHEFSRSCLDEAGNWKVVSPKTMPVNPDEGLIFQDPPLARPVLPPIYTFPYPAASPFTGLIRAE